jgi:hypothetical protein
MTNDQLLESYFVKDYKSFKNYQSLSESEKKTFSKSLVTKLFNTVKNKSLGVNYNNIEKSKGDITKVNNYMDLDNCIHILVNMYNSNPSKELSVILRLKETQDIFLKYKNDFIRGFTQKNEIVMLTYTNMVAALISGTARIIATSIDYVKQPDNTFQRSFKKVNKGMYDKDVYFKSLTRFCNMEKKGELKQILNTRRLNEAFDIGITENCDILDESIAGIFAVGMAVIVGVFLLLVAIRGLVFTFFHLKNGLANSLLMMSYFLEEHANNLDTSEGKNAKIKEKQLKIVAKLKALSKKLSIEDEDANKKAKKDEEEDDKKNQEDSSSSGDSDSNDDVLL